MNDPQVQQSIETIKVLWIALGVLLASNAGTFIKIILDHFAKKKLKEESELKSKETNQDEAIRHFTLALEKNNNTLLKIDKDLQRLFTAVKLLAGKKWPTISKIIQENINQ